jgi:hypothetical protein
LAGVTVAGVGIAAAGALYAAGRAGALYNGEKC